MLRILCMTQFVNFYLRAPLTFQFELLVSSRILRVHSQRPGVDRAVRWDDSKPEVDARLRRAVHSARYRSAGAHGGTLCMHRGGQQGEGQCSNEELCKLHLH